MLLVCLILTAGAFVASKNMINEKARLKFDSDWRGIAFRIQHHMNAYIDQLYASRGLFAASKSVERDEWQVFIQKQRLDERFPGIVASEFIAAIKEDDLAGFIQSVRTDQSRDPQGYSSFDINPKIKKENYYIVKYIEPFEVNREVFGYDMDSEATRAECLRQAAETNEPTASGRIQLVQNPSETGLILALPVYENGRPTSSLSERILALQGFVVNIISADVFFRNHFIQSREMDQIDFEIFDSEKLTAEHAIFDFDNALHAIDRNYKARFSVNVPITIAGRTFVMHCTASQSFGLQGGQAWFPWWVLGGGLVFSAVFFLLMLTLVDSESRAQAYADKKTREIKLLLESLAEGIYGVDLKGDCIFINSAALKILGYQSQEVMGKNVHQLAHFKKATGEPHSVEDCPIYKAFKSGTFCRVDDEVLWRKDGTSFPVTYSTAPIIDAGNITGSLCTFSDITEQKARMKEFLRLNAIQSRFAAIVESSDDAIMSHDLMGVITSWNRAAERILGYSESEAVGLPIAMLIPADYQHEELMIIAKISNGERIDHFETVRMKKNGDRVYVSVTISPMKDDKGNVVGASKIVRDITRLKEAEAAMRAATCKATEASRAKSDFLATMSHEIRTPMNAILGMADLLTETPLSTEQKDYVSRLTRGGETLLSIVNDVLDLSKIEAGAMDLEMIDFDLYDHVGKTVDLLALKAHQKGLDLNLQLDPSIPSVLRSDPMRLRQILLNLLNNSIKFTAKGEISLKIIVEKSSVENGKKTCQLHFSVADTGIGILKDKVENLFEPFMQADSSTTRKYGGTGLGLNICKRLVELMGGQIWVVSAEGKGSEFHFVIPLEISDTLSLLTRKDDAAFAGKNILIVDDNEANRLILVHHLKGWGVNVEEAANGVLALQKMSAAGARPYDLIILDCRMPGMGGFDVAEAFKKENKPYLPMIVMLTSDNRTGDIRLARELGFADYVVKPVKKEALQEALLKIFSKSEKSDPTPPGQDLKDAETSMGALVSLRILLVDDSEDNQNLIQAYLKKIPCVIDVANNGQVACEKTDIERYDLVLMDMQMPVMDGYTATRLIRERELSRGEPKHLAIIALTANALSEDTAKCLAAGCDAYLSKPIKKTTLLNALLPYFTSQSL